jgi:hypothetical protein
MAPFAGMDTTNNPGQAVMADIFNLSNVWWSGMYLDSPAPVPGEVAKTKPLNGHNLMGGIGANPVGSWMRAWGELHAGTFSGGWGLLPIYWGQQDPANNDGPIDLRTFIAVANAEDAAVKAANAGIPPGAVIYLDWEIGGAPGQTGVDYCKTWFRRLAQLGFRPGVYCHPPSSLRFRRECPHLFVWNVNLTAGSGGITVSGGNVFFDLPPVVAGGEPPDRDAIARQWRFGVTQPAGGPIASFPNVDLDVATVADPAFPERGNIPSETRSGPVAVTTHASDWLAASAVRRGKLVRVSWSPGAPALDADLDGPSMNGWLNPFAQTSATRQPIGGQVVEWLAGIALESQDAPTTWEVHTFRGGPGGVWTQHPVEMQLQLDPLTGAVIAQRSGGVPEVFAYDRDGDTLAGARWIEAQQQWTMLEVLKAPGDVLAAPGLIRTNGFTALSRAQGLLDLFFVGRDSLVRTSFSTAPGAWSVPFPVTDPTVRVHAMANLAAVSPREDRIEVVFIARRDGDPAYHLYAAGWSQALLWLGPGTRQIGGPLALEPMSRIAACSRKADFVDVFVVDDKGHLLNTFLDVASGTWNALRPVGGTQVLVADVVGAVCRGPDDVEVLVTARDGTVCATHWDQTMADFRPLERITMLDLDNQ